MKVLLEVGIYRVTSKGFDLVVRALHEVCLSARHGFELCRRKKSGIKWGRVEERAHFPSSFEPCTTGPRGFLGCIIFFIELLFFEIYRIAVSLEQKENANSEES